MLETTLGALFDKAVQQYAKQEAIKDPFRSVSYAQLGEETNRLANALIGRGVQRGDRVALWMNNCIEYVVAEFALAKIGAVRVPLNTFLNVEEVAYRLDDAEVMMVICGVELLPHLEQVLKKTHVHPQIVTIGGKDENSYVHLISQASVAPPSVKVEPDDLAAIMYTGGTTGRSKGVMHTHKSNISIIYSEIVELEMERGVVFLHVAPLPHAAGFMILPGLLRGGRHIIQQGFHPITVCETIEQEKVTFLFLVPTMIYMLLDMPERDRYDFSSLQTMVYGAAPMAPARIKQALEVWGPILAQVYSQMEVANQTTILTKADHITRTPEEERRLASCGRSMIMSQVRIVDEQGQDVPPGVVGEIITRGPHMMKGYWRKEKETREVIRDGWLYTGDMAYQDEEGYIYLVDRKKDMVISGGFNVYSTTVENALHEHPAVRQAAVIGVPDEKWGEAIKAFVVAEPGAVDEKTLIHFCKERLASYEVPKTIEFVDALPLTAYGKVDKKALRKP